MREPFIARVGEETKIVNKGSTWGFRTRVWEKVAGELNFAAKRPVIDGIAPHAVGQIVLLLVQNHPSPLIGGFLRMYENQAFRFRASTVQGAVVFGFSPGKVVVPFGPVGFGLAEAASRQTMALRPGSAGGSPGDVMHVIRLGITELLGVAYAEAGPVFPHAQLRLILVTAGPFEVNDTTAETLRNAHVTIDWLCLKAPPSPKLVVPRVQAPPSARHRPVIDPGDAVRLVHAAGGGAISISTEAALKAIVESEAFLNLNLRHREPNSGSGFDTEFRHQQVAAAEVRAKMRPALPTRRAPVTNSRTKRILQELEYASKCDDPDIQVFSTDALDEWRVFIRGPESTPYRGVWWYLVVTFPVDYPLHPPKFRYISVPFHVNVSVEGRICLNVLEKEYVVTAAVFELLVYIRTLFECPNYDDPIDSDKKALATFDRTGFNRMVLQSRANGKKSVEDWLAQLDAAHG
jgi:ubiquitin-protein ligase